jgi:hypothetical protein
MKIFIYIVLSFLLIITLFSCSNDLYSNVYKLDIEPEVTKPNVHSLAQENIIIIDWGIDSAADEYILFRDTAPNGDFDQAVYHGKELSYTDDQVTSETFYYYKLAKRQGARIFDKSGYAYGITNVIKKDAYENNDTIDNAKLIDIVTDANIFYYKDNYGNTVEDRDWYYVTLSSRRILTITIDDYLPQPYNNELNFNVETDVPAVINMGPSISIYNTAYTEKDIRFQVSLNKGAILTNEMIASYKITVIEENIIE